MVIVDKGRWTRKPLPTEKVEIDWSQALARGLNGYYLLNEGGSNVRNLARPRYPGALTAGARWGVTQKGVGVLFAPPDDSVVITAPADLLRSNNFSWLTRVFFKTTATVQICIEQVETGGYFIRNSTGAAQFGRSNTAVDLSLAGQFVDASWYDFGLTLDATTARIYINGTDVGNVAFTQVTPTGNIQFGARTIGDGLDGCLLFVQMYDRALSAPEMKALSAEPYAFLRPVIRRTYFVGGGTDKTIVDAGSGTESLSISVAAAISETGAGSDVPSIAAAADLSDAGTGAEILSITAQLTAPDTGLGADTVTVDQGADSKIVSDTGSGSDAIASIVAQVAVPDTGGGVETVAIVAALTVADAGAGAEQVAVIAQIPITDLATGLDTLDVLAALGVSDTGSGAETILAGITAIEISDVASGSEILTVSATLTLADAGAAAESVLVDTGLIAAIIKLTGVALAVPKLSNVALAAPKLTGVALII